MPPKVQQKTKEAKLKAALSGGKGRKKKWSKGKVKEKAMNLVLFDKPTYEKMMKDLPKSKMLTTAIVAEKAKINGSLARVAMRHMVDEDLIQPVGDQHHTFMLYTRKIKGGEE